MVSLFLLLGCNFYIVDLFAALHEPASASSRTLLKLASSVRALLKPYGDTLIRQDCCPVNQSTCFFTSDSDFFFFTFPKKWVGRVMGNETFYGDGLTLRLLKTFFIGSRPACMKSKARSNIHSKSDKAAQHFSWIAVSRFTFSRPRTNKRL